MLLETLTLSVALQFLLSGVMLLWNHRNRSLQVHAPFKLFLQPSVKGSPNTFIYHPLNYTVVKMLDHSQCIPCCHIRFMNVVLSSSSHFTFKVFMILLQFPSMFNVSFCWKSYWWVWLWISCVLDNNHSRIVHFTYGMWTGSLMQHLKPL